MYIVMKEANWTKVFYQTTSINPCNKVMINITSMNHDRNDEQSDQGNVAHITTYSYAVGKYPTGFKVLITKI